MNQVLSLSAEFGEDSEEKTAKQRGYDSIVKQPVHGQHL